MSQQSSIASSNVLQTFSALISFPGSIMEMHTSLFIAVSGLTTFNDTSTFLISSLNFSNFETFLWIKSCNFSVASKWMA